MKYSASQYLIRNAMVFGATLITFLFLIVFSANINTLFTILSYLFLGLLVVLLLLFLWSIIRFFKVLFTPDTKATSHFFVMVFSFLMFIVFPVALLVLLALAAITILPLLG